jgi:hypothetical protein
LTTKAKTGTPDPGDYTVRIVKAKTEITQRGTEIAGMRLRIIDG